MRSENELNVEELRDIVQDAHLDFLLALDT